MLEREQVGGEERVGGGGGGTRLCVAALGHGWQGVIMRELDSC